MSVSYFSQGKWWLRVDSVNNYCRENVLSRTQSRKHTKGRNRWTSSFTTLLLTSVCVSSLWSPASEVTGGLAAFPTCAGKIKTSAFVCIDVSVRGRVSIREGTSICRLITGTPWRRHVFCEMWKWEQCMELEDIDWWLAALSTCG